MTPYLGILARASASSRVVNAGSCRIISRIATAAPSAGRPHDAGVAGMPVNATGPPPTVWNAVVNKPNAIVTANGFGRQSPSQHSQHPKSSRRHQRPTQIPLP